MPAFSKGEGHKTKVMEETQKLGPGKELMGIINKLRLKRKKRQMAEKRQKWTWK
jgi:hypothetical protein